jgi:SAM-dependent methyltransferase
MRVGTKSVLKRKVRLAVIKILSNKSKAAFLTKFRGKKISLFDVGCGANSPALTKTILPNCHYTGLDVGMYFQDEDSIEFADKFELCSPEDFATVIEKKDEKFDVIVSSHNLEHCYERVRVLLGMLKCLKSGGQMFLSFPCEASVAFPKRNGCLNYYDDKTHNDKPPQFDELCNLIEKEGFKILYGKRRYRPPLLASLGLLLEPISFFIKKTLPGTWALYGFESIIHIASKADETSGDANL